MIDWIRVVRYLVKNKMWYIEAKWSPSDFMKYAEKAEQYNAEKSKQSGIWHRLYLEKQKDYDRLNQWVNKEQKSLEGEIVHLKDLIQAKNLIIENLTKGENHETKNKVFEN